jgi:hydrogenase assembly chaperone HypC/HupF
VCLGEVAQVVQLGPGSSALVRSAQRTATVSLLTLAEVVEPGDWVVCHSGFALARVSADEAAEARAIRATDTHGPPDDPAPPRKETP